MSIGTILFCFPIFVHKDIHHNQKNSSTCQDKIHRRTLHCFVEKVKIAVDGIPDRIYDFRGQPLLLRFIYVHNIRIKYLPVDMVTMRLGGASTSGLKSRMTGMQEHLRSFRENGVKTNRFLLSLRYFYKITEYFRKK